MIARRAHGSRGFAADELNLQQAWFLMWHNGTARLGPALIASVLAASLGCIDQFAGPVPSRRLSHQPRGWRATQEPVRRLDFDFTDGPEGWIPQFADYPQGAAEGYHLISGFRPLPAPLDGGSGIFISGHNLSDDLFMFLKRKVREFDPGTRYRLSFTVEFATNAPMGCSGAGGAPGESVYLKVGASTEEPVTTVDEDGLLRLNIDKGNQSTGGANAVVIGNVANSLPCQQDVRRYQLKRLETTEPVSVTADANGSFWLLVGTDSGYEGVTSIYYTHITVEVRR
jgi:hypothetical protein